MRRVSAVLAIAWLCAFCAGRSAHAAATITLQNNDAAGEGFNDPTPAAPVGGNVGTTLGQQRLIAALTAANRWGAALNSVVPIVIEASVTVSPSCSGELGEVGFIPAQQNFPGAPFADTLYPGALANKLAGVDLSPSAPDFTLTLCSPPGAFYLGLDGNHGAQLDLVSHFMHLMAHGLGFWNATASNGGNFLGGRPAVWDHFLFDNSVGKRWVEMTDSERVASLTNAGNVVWLGANAVAAVPTAYALAPRVTIAGPEAGAAAGEIEIAAASFGPPIGASPLVAQLMPADACGTLGTLDALAVQGNVALIDREPACADVFQARMAQDAGALAAVLIDDTGSLPPPAPTGFDPSVTIPAFAISSVDGAVLVDALAHRGRRASGVTVQLGSDPSQRLGADALGRPLIYTPVLFTGSGPSHWDPSARPNQLMEPAQPPGVPHSLGAPSDLTLELLQDIGW